MMCTLQSLLPSGRQEALDMVHGLQTSTSAQKFGRPLPEDY